MMNNVHEQCPNSDSETVLSQKIGWVHQVHSLLAQLAHPGAHRRARVAILWRPQPAVSQAPTGRVMGAGRHVAGAPLAVSWLSCVVLRHSPASNSFILTIHCSVLRHKIFQPSLLFQSRYTQCIVTQCLKPTSGHNTLLCIAIQSFPSPPAAPVTIQLLYCNTTHSHPATSVTIQIFVS